MRREVLVERAGLTSEVDKERALQLGNRRVEQAIGRTIDLVRLHVRRADHLAVERVCPRVMRALDWALQCAGARVAVQRTAVAADIVERPQRAVVVVHDDDVLPGDIGRVVRTRLGDMLRPTSTRPTAPEDALELALEGSWRSVQIGGKGYVATIQTGTLKHH